MVTLFDLKQTTAATTFTIIAITLVERATGHTPKIEETDDEKESE